MNTEERLKRLEGELIEMSQRLARMERVQVGAAVGAALAQDTEIRALRFVVADKYGEPRAVLSASKLGLYDMEGNPRVELEAIDKGESALRLYDEDGKPCVVLSASKTRAALRLYEVEGKTRAELVVNKYGPSLDLADEKGKTRVLLDTSVKRGPSMALLDKKGKLLWNAP